jgi:hypothetical protein
MSHLIECSYCLDLINVILENLVFWDENIYLNIQLKIVNLVSLIVFHLFLLEECLRLERLAKEGLSVGQI